MAAVVGVRGGGRMVVSAGGGGGSLEGRGGGVRVGDCRAWQ